MSLKTIVVHVDNSPRLSERINIAAQIALQHDAHLIGVAPSGWSPYVLSTGGFDAMVAPIADEMARIRRATEQALADFEAQARRLGVVSIESRMVDEEAGTALAMHGALSDLVVLGQTHGTEPDMLVRGDIPEYVVLNCATPVLMVPSGGSFDIVGRRVVIAWNGSAEAMRAVRSALPVLQRAQLVQLLIINPSSLRAMEQSGEPGADMAQYLARHQVKVELVTRSQLKDADQALVDVVAECGADLLVMGAYGRSRFREFLMGGASRTMLDGMRVPVWMAH
jgi:nucleotide-binding universal stress UspA family protein